jgi:type I restriction enzyme M protein
MVSVEEIEKNEFNLNLPRYIDSQAPEDLQDIPGHLQGGVPIADVDGLQRYWDVCQQLRHTLFKQRRPSYVDLAVEKSAIKSTIYEHPEFATFIAGMNAHFSAWQIRSAEALKALKTGCHPKDVIATLSECLLPHYADKPLIDGYDVYQQLMDYWADTMQDDVYIVSADGWKAETARIIEKDKKGKEKDKGWTCDLVPKALIVARYFAKEQAAIEKLETEYAALAAKMKAEWKTWSAMWRGMESGITKFCTAVELPVEQLFSTQELPAVIEQARERPDHVREVDQAVLCCRFKEGVARLGAPWLGTLGVFGSEVDVVGRVVGDEPLAYLRDQALPLRN